MNLLYRRTQLHRPGFFVSAIYTTAQVFATKNLMKNFKHVDSEARMSACDMETPAASKVSLTIQK